MSHFLLLDPTLFEVQLFYAWPYCFKWIFKIESLICENLSFD
jgi:hypothetical protein